MVAAHRRAACRVAPRQGLVEVVVILSIGLVVWLLLTDLHLYLLSRRADELAKQIRAMSERMDHMSARSDVLSQRLDLRGLP